MAMIGSKLKRISGCASCCGLAAALLAALPAWAEAPSARVTAVTGTAAAGGAQLEPRMPLADGDPIQTGADGACSILVDGDAVLELCQGTSLRLGHRDAAAGAARVLQLQRGEIRVMAEPRSPEERIEIHTPAVIATVLGSIVYVAVDAQGVTTIASGEHDVRVESARRLGSSLIVQAGQQVTIRPGAALPKAAVAWNPNASAADGCLIDFRSLAYEDARPQGESRALETITGLDLVDDLPAVSLGAEGRWDSPVPDRWIDPKLHRILEPIDTGAVRPEESQP
jgi:ferric-dicitrate binding protein FerR (iron transport regulator)